MEVVDAAAICGDNEIRRSNSYHGPHDAESAVDVAQGVGTRSVRAGHHHAVCDRAAAIAGPNLVMRDSTDFSYQQKDMDAAGTTRINICGGHTDDSLE